ncbi:MAG: immunoglobulin-like domain-containing protein [Bryobacteraceae bacterium]
MTRRFALFLVGFLAMFLTGCPDEPGLPAPPPPAPLDPQYVACISTTPIDAGNPNEPVITLIGPRVTSQPLGSVYVDAGATANDPHDGDITSQITVTGLTELNPNAVGDYLVRYNVVDSAQLPAVEVVRVVRVTDGTFTEQTPRDIGTTSAHLPYYEHLPVHYSNDPAQKFPVLVYQHGWSGARFTSDGTAVQLPLSGLATSDLVGLINNGLWDDSRPFIVLSPQRCVDPLTYVVTAYETKLFIDYAINTYNIDTSRIYLGGFSQGSGDTWDYVTNYPHQLAAVVPISGPYGNTSGCLLKDTPAWAFQAADDPYVLPQGQIDTVNSINNCNPPVRAKLTLFPTGGHTDQTMNLAGLGQGLAPYDVYDQSIYDWLLTNSRTSGAPALQIANAAGIQAGASASAAQAAATVEPVVVALTVNRATIRFGQSATLAWTAAGAESCVASGDWSGGRPAKGAESFVPPAPGSYGYVLTCSGPGGVSTQSLSLTVQAVDDSANQASSMDSNTQPVRTSR